MIGRGAAVAQVHGVELHGKAAFVAWLGVHALLMTGGSNRVNAFKSWADRLLREGTRAGGARPERHGSHAVGRRRRGRDGRVRGRCGMSANDFDVIIIGSGAGGGTLARHLAPSGKKVLILERGGWLPREIENWDADEVFDQEPVRVGGHLVRRQGQGVPARDPLLRRRPDQVLRSRPVPAAARGLRRAPPSRRRVARVAHHLRRAGAVLHEGRAAVRGPRRPGRGPDRAVGERAVPVPGRDRTSRASSSCPTTSPRRATTRSTPRAACGCSKATCPTARASGAPPATASRRWSRRSPTPRSSASGRR